MSTRTTYYNLTKPDGAEHVDKDVINQNYDVIDLQMHANSEAASGAIANTADAYDDTATYTVGDYCIYADTLYRCTADTSGAFDATKWTQTNIAEAFEPKHTWSLFETITADGTEFQYIRDLPEYTSGIMVVCYFKETTQSATHFRTEISFDGTNYTIYGYIGSAITSGDRYGRINIERDGNLWTSYSTDASTSAGGIALARVVNDACIVTSDAVQKIKLRTTSSQTNIESGSTLEIYIRR